MRPAPEPAPPPPPSCDEDILSIPVGLCGRLPDVRLESFRVTSFRNILDSTQIPVDEHVTCLVGKNESGKTALLQALHRVNPAQDVRFDLEDQYPRWLLSRHRRRGIAKKAKPIAVTFALDADDVAAVERDLGVGVLGTHELHVARGYDGEVALDVAVDGAAAVASLVGGVASGAASALAGAEGLDQLVAVIAELRAGDGASRVEAALRTVEAAIRDRYHGGTVEDAAAALLWPRVPRFFYFSDYGLLDGRIDLRRLEPSAAGASGADGLETARALLDLAGADMARVEEDSYERRKAELDSVSADLSREVATFWKQNDQLEVVIDIDKETVQAPGYPRGHTAVARFLEIRVRDRRHGFTTNFGQRSSGFQWFFSFLAAFSAFEDSDDPIIVLLDEPALTLHGRAQADFLRFIDERLASKHQVLYTTHSPYMIAPDGLGRVRIVEDRGPKEGAVASADVLSGGRDSALPLQGALGYELAQSLFAGPDNLVLEGVSDLIYLTVLSDFLSQFGRAHLDPRWQLAPVGGMGTLPVLVALLGRPRDMTILLSPESVGMEHVYTVAGGGSFEAQRLVTVSEITGTELADVEDLFDRTDYIQLYTATFNRRVAVARIPSGERVVAALTALRGMAFDRQAPATRLLRNADAVCRGLSETTLERFEQLFVRLNGTLRPASES